MDSGTERGARTSVSCDFVFGLRFAWPREIAAEFKTYCKRSGTRSEKTASTYIRQLEIIKTVVKPDDLYDYSNKYKKTLTPPQRNAILKFFNFIYDVKHLKTFNDYDIEDFRQAVRNTEKSKATRQDTRTRYLTHEEIRAGREAIPDDAIKKLYSILYYSGARLAQMGRILENAKWLEIEKFGDVIVLMVHARSLGITNNVSIYISPHAVRSMLEVSKLIVTNFRAPRSLWDRVEPKEGRSM